MIELACAVDMVIRLHSSRYTQVGATFRNNEVAIQAKSQGRLKHA